MHDNAGQDPVQDSIALAMSNQDTPKLYSNQFSCALTNGDIVVLLRKNNKDEAVLNLSYTMAKTLSLYLANLVSNFEQKTGNTIMTTNDVDALLTRNGDQ